MRFRTKERREFDETIAGPRRLWLRLHPICWFNCCNPSQCVHEIGTEGNRKAFVGEVCSWAAACSNCNLYELTNYRKFPVVDQLAFKLIYDPDNLDLARYNRLRHRGPEAITMGEVLLAKSRILANDEG
jgi:hypothetical protein